MHFDLPGMRGGESTLSTTAEATKNGLFLTEQGVFLFITVLGVLGQLYCVVLCVLCIGHRLVGSTVQQRLA